MKGFKTYKEAVRAYNTESNCVIRQRIKQTAKRQRRFKEEDFRKKSN